MTEKTIFKDAKKDDFNGHMELRKRSVILGIDPGTYITGYGVILSPSQPIDFGCIRPPRSLPEEERYLWIFEAVLTLITQHHPSAIAVENQFFYKNAQSVLTLAMAKATVLLAAAQKKIPIYQYNPMVVKKSVAGTGSASKEQMQRMIQLLLKLPAPPEPADAADALALALCHIHRIKTPL